MTGPKPQTTSEEPKARKRIVWQAAHEYLRERPVPETRLATPFPFLNNAFGGGLWPITLLVIQGAPSAGKSSIGIQIAGHCARQHGSKVYIYAPDEGTRSACVRLGQAAGIDRDLLELTRPEAIEALERAYGKGKINLVDADAPEALLETFLDQIREEYKKGDPPPIFYADSIQTIRTDLDAEYRDRRLTIGYVMQTIREFTRDVPAIAELVSHVNRSHYAAKKEEDRIDPLAAAAEAIEITRAADALLDLSGNRWAPEGVKAWLRKNRLHRGEEPIARLRYDVPLGGFTEIDPEELKALEESQVDEKQKARQEANEKRRQKAAEMRVERIVSLIYRRPWKLSKSKIYAEIGGRKEDIFEMVDNLSDPRGSYRIKLDESSGLYGPADITAPEPKQGVLGGTE